MRLRRGCSGAWIALLAAAADRLTKALALRLPQGVTRALVPGLMNLRMTWNSGVAFSMLSGRGALPTLLTLLLLAGLVALLVARPEGPRGYRAGLWLIVGGGLGNLYDRLVYGRVIDFLEPAFVRFAVFNVADVCVCAGAALAIVALLVDELARRKRGMGRG